MKIERSRICTLWCMPAAEWYSLARRSKTVGENPSRRAVATAAATAGSKIRYVMDQFPVEPEIRVRPNLLCSSRSMSSNVLLAKYSVFIVFGASEDSLRLPVTTWDNRLPASSTLRSFTVRDAPSGHHGGGNGLAPLPTSQQDDLAARRSLWGTSNDDLVLRTGWGTPRTGR